MRQTCKLSNQDNNGQIKFSIYLGPVKGEIHIKGWLAGLFRKTLKQQHR